MKLVFMGTPEFAVPSLIKLHKSSHNIVTVVTGPDKRRGRGKDLSPTPVKKTALELGLPVLEVLDLKSEEFYNKLESLQPDLFVVVAFRILSKRVLAIPKTGSINLHASLLPKYRGAAPIHWAVVNGDAETGCSIFFLSEEVDGGKILLQRKTPIGMMENTGEVYDRLKDLGSDLLAEAVDRIASGSYELQEQDERQSTPAPKVFNEDAFIDFRAKALEVHNRIRGMNPFPGAWTTIDGNRLKLLRARPADSEPVSTGNVDIVDGSVIVGCGSGTLELLDVQMQGRSPMRAIDFFNGYRGNRALGA
ncbi:MAG TPA: methionyl-tRNA formyltransferase [Balneolales bacterium]|nr:methionyl-tRNA formyltransferase [Balneolales bacterium]